jgi:biotin transport system permease protein
MAGKIKRVTVFGYRAGKTLLHRMPAGLKLIFVIIISAFAFVSVYGLAASVLLLLIACAFARIPPHSLLKGSKPLVILSLCIILLKSIIVEGEGITVSGLHIPFISGKGFLQGLLAAPGLFVPFAAAALLFGVTTMRELRLSLALVEKGLTCKFPRKGAKAQRTQREEGHIPFLSLGLSLMLGFIPRFFEMWDDANLACDSRSCKRGLRRMFLLLPLVTERMMEASANTALALEARAWGASDTGRDK